MKTYKLRLEEKMSSAKFEETGSYIMLLSMVISLILDCYSISFLIFDPLVLLPPPSFILSHLLISAFHVHARWLVLILVSSAPPKSLHVAAVRLIITVQMSPLY